MRRSRSFQKKEEEEEETGKQQDEILNRQASNRDQKLKK